MVATANSAMAWVMAWLLVQIMLLVSPAPMQTSIMVWLAASIMVQGSPTPAVLAMEWPAASMEAPAGTAKAGGKRQGPEDPALRVRNG
jgi:hypothetical protein